jgi:MFS family permease
VSKNKPKLWTKDFILVSTVNFMLTLIFFLLLVTIAVYAVEAYGATASEAGLVTGIFIIGTLSGRLVTGTIMERVGRKRILLIGLSLFTLTTLLYFVNWGLTFLLINRFLHGMTLGMAATAAGTIIAQIIPPTRRGEGIGYFSMSATLSTAIGPFVGLYMLQHSTFPIIFAFCLALGVTSLVIAAFVKVPTIEVPKKAEKTNGFKISNFLEPRAIPIAVVTLAIAFCFSSVLSFISFYAIDLDLIEAASYFFLVYAITVLATRPFTGRLLDRKGANYVMYPALLALAGGLLLLSNAHNSFTLLLAGALIGLGFGNMQSSTQAIAVKLTPPHRMGLATATFFIFLEAGMGFGPYLLGFIIAASGYSTMYAILSGGVLAAAVLYYFLHGRRDREKIAAAEAYRP